jgi:site-specific DNA-methyltransferase (adenine-specific)
MFYNEDCVSGAKKHLADNSVDLIICDPPYGINGEKLDKHYNRNEGFVLDGYIDVPADEYERFSSDWIKQAERVLRPGGSIYIVSGYTNLRHILNAISNTMLKEINHIIWKYNFGVYTKNKFVSSHYHILYCVKPKGNVVFNTNSRFSDCEKDENGSSLNYQDREDVWVINREYKPGQVKNKNELPTQLLTKIIQYSSNENDLVCDFFLGSFSTAKIALGLNRNACGFEKSKIAFDYQIEQIKKIEKGELLKDLRRVPENSLFSQGLPLSNVEKEKIVKMFYKLKQNGVTKKDALNQISKAFGRGYWSLTKVIGAQVNVYQTTSSDLFAND